MTHEPAKMVFAYRSCAKARHSTRLGIRHFNHWFNVYKCPVCGREVSHKRQPITCKGGLT